MVRLNLKFAPLRFKLGEDKLCAAYETNVKVVTVKVICSQKVGLKLNCSIRLKISESSRKWEFNSKIKIQCQGLDDTGI